MQISMRIFLAQTSGSCQMCLQNQRQTTHRKNLAPDARCDPYLRRMSKTSMAIFATGPLLQDGRT